jgi:hypothetical protein
MADDGILCKTLFYDITKKARVPAVIASVDASNCHDRIAHAMTSMIFQVFGVPTSAIESMLGAIENMKFFLRTNFGDSKTFAGGSISIKTQGLCRRQWCFAGKVGGYQHLYTASTWVEGPGCMISLPNHKFTTTPKTDKSKRRTVEFGRKVLTDKKSG